MSFFLFEVLYLTFPTTTFGNGLFPFNICTDIWKAISQEGYININLGEVVTTKH